ncbi:MAG: phosphoserine phosphatase SerB, partial [Pseudomonadota bacterium]
MTFVITLVASDIKNHPVLEEYAPDGENQWIEEGKALDIFVDKKIDVPPLRQKLDAHKIDVFITAKENRRKKLLIADMDSTIVEGETLDDLAAFAGLKDQIAAITARAMNGELDFEEAIRERVGLLKGLSEDKLAEALIETKLNPGAESFVLTMKAHGAYCVLVSGGFTVFTNEIAQRIGFHANHGNILGMEGGALDGTVKDPILDKNAKVYFLDLYLKEHGLNPDDAITIGDGAN